VREFTITAADRSLADAIARCYPLEARGKRASRTGLVQMLGDGTRESSNDEEASAFTDAELLEADLQRDADKAAQLAQRNDQAALQLQIQRQGDE
jgi:hypothetical protein